MESVRIRRLALSLVECQRLAEKIAHWHSWARSASVRCAWFPSGVVEVRRNPPPNIPAGTILRICLVILAVAVAVLLVYELRKPLTYLFIAIFLAIALARPVAFFERRMRRGLAIAVVYVLLLRVPIGIRSLLVPPLVAPGGGLPRHVPPHVDHRPNLGNHSH